jgi:serine O-acetyltransferase
MLRVRCSLEGDALAGYVARQLNSAYPDGAEVSEALLRGLVPRALVRVETCFSAIDNKYFFDGESAVFDHLHGDQYAMFLYLLSNEAWRSGEPGAAKKLFLLNKALFGIDAYYEVELPAIFLFVHPLATVLGRATYADHLIVYQRVGIGSNHGVYPTLGRHLTLHPGAKVLGRCTVGDHCTIASEAFLLDRDLAGGMLYMGGPSQPVIKQRPEPAPIWRRV